MKLHRRALFTTGHINDGSTCQACSEKENQLHLATCQVITNEYWDEIAKLLNMMGAEDPDMSGDPVSFFLFGRTSDDDVICQETADILFIAWRCLYAAITQSRLERTPLNLSKAYERVIQLLTSRVKAHASGWERWTWKGRHTSRAHLIPQKYQDNLLFQQEMSGEWYICTTLRSEASRLQLHK